MQNKKKLLAFLAVMVVSVVSLSSSANAAGNWKDYFSRDEAQSIKKMTDKYIREQIEENSKEWKGLISGKLIEDGAIKADKVDASIAKRKIYTGTMPTSKVGADFVDTSDSFDPDYYKKILVPEINVDRTPQVTLYSKTDMQMPPESNLWRDETDSVLFKDGVIWIKYGLGEEQGTLDTSDDAWYQMVGEYKLVISY